MAAASVAILLLIGGLWMILGDNKAEMNELVRIEAQQSMMYILPDSTKGPGQTAPDAGGAGAPFLPEWGRGRNVSALSIEFFGESW